MVTLQQIEGFRALFAGRTDVHGTFDPATGKAWQKKSPVTMEVVRRHLDGVAPLGVYPLVGSTTFFAAADFDDGESAPPLAFCRQAWRMGLSCYLERSKSKGYHVWVFFAEPGVKAAKARTMLQRILAEIGCPNVEIFPKHDQLSGGAKFGNFINLPLFGRFAKEGRMVFVDRHLQPLPDQWDFLSKAERITAACLDNILAKHGVSPVSPGKLAKEPTTPLEPHTLPPCAERMLREGVRANQRVACFRLAVQLKKAGVPFDGAVGRLSTWAQRNRPIGGKSIIRESEIRSQTRCAYNKGYRGCGCEDPAVSPFCEPSCGIRTRPSG
jgi:hypothetical protein